MDTGVFCGYSTTKQKVMIRTCLLDFSTLCYVLLPASVTRGRNLFRLAPFTMRCMPVGRTLTSHQFMRM